MAVLGCAEDVGVEVNGPEFGDVIDDDEVGVEVDDAADGGGEEVGEVDAGVVEGLVEGPAEGGRDLVADKVVVEVVEGEGEVGEGGGMVRRRLARRWAVARKWKERVSGQAACWRTEKTPATEPRR